MRQEANDICRNLKLCKRDRNRTTWYDGDKKKERIKLSITIKHSGVQGGGFFSGCRWCWTGTTWMYMDGYTSGNNKMPLKQHGNYAQCEYHQQTAGTTDNGCWTASKWAGNEWESHGGKMLLLKMLRLFPSLLVVFFFSRPSWCVKNHDLAIMRQMCALGYPTAGTGKHSRLSSHTRQANRHKYYAYAALHCQRLLNCWQLV